jgi:hypothetical protein
MGKTKTYSNATGFRRALEDRIKTHAGTEAGEIQRLRRQVSFDRFLARLFTLSPSPWVLKGGYAMQLRLDSARATKDVDLAVRDGKLFSPDAEKQNEAILEIISERAELDLGDFFTFVITGPIKDLDAAPYGGARFHIESRIDDRTFDKFHLDIGIGDIWIEPFDQVESLDFLDFAGINDQTFPTITKEQQFAEKFHAYTLPRTGEIKNSRVKDLVDMILLINTQDLDAVKLKSATEETFKRRATHDIPMQIPTPPMNWIGPFAQLANEVKLEEDANSAYLKLEAFCKTIKLT